MLTRRTWIGLVSSAAALALAVCPFGLASAQVRNQLILTVTDSPDPAPSLGQISYKLTVKNNGTSRATTVVVTLAVPQGAAFVKCTAPNKAPCTASGGIVTTTLPVIKAHAAPSISVVLQMPLVSVTSTLSISAGANGDNASDDKATITTTVLAASGIPVVYLPSNRQGTVSCGQTLGPIDFGSDTTVQLLSGMGCASSQFGLKIAASGKTLDLNKNKIVGTQMAGNVGILIGANAINVTVTARSTGGSTGVEYFDTCLMDEGGNAGLMVNLLRCYRARSAAFDIVSNGVTLSHLLTDNTIAVTGLTAIPPGGVGIHANGDNIHIQDVIVRRSGTIGIWADGTDADHNGRVVTIDGSSSTMQVQTSYGVGIQLDNGPHAVKDAQVIGDGIAGTSTDGVVIGPTGTGNTLDGVVVKSHGGNGIVINGTATQVDRSSVDPTVGLDAFVSAGSNTELSGNSANALGNGFVISGPDNSLTSNSTKAGGDGYVLSGDRPILRNNDATGNGGRGFRVISSGGTFNTNTAQSNAADGFLVTGSAAGFSGNQSKQNAGAGFAVSGSGNDFNTNSVELNGDSGWIIGPNNIDSGGNRVSGSVFSFTSAGGTFN